MQFAEKKVPYKVEANTLNKVVFNFKMPTFMRGEYVIGCALANGTMEGYEILTWLYNVIGIRIVNNGNNSGIVDVETKITWYTKKEGVHE